MKNQNNLKIDVRKFPSFSNGMKTIFTIFVVAALFLIIPSVSLAATVTTFATLPAQISGMAIDTAGNLYTVNGNNTINKVTPSGTVTTFATLPAQQISGMAIDTAGNLYVGNYSGGTIIKVTPSGAVSTFATIPVGNPIALAFDTAGNLYVSNWAVGPAPYYKQINGTISKITPSGTVTTFAIVGISPTGLAFDTAGNLYVANTNDYANTKVPSTINKITPSGTVTTFATITPAYASISSVTTYTDGNLYITNVNGLSKITPSGTVTLVLPDVIGKPVLDTTTGYLYFNGVIRYPNDPNHGYYALSKITPSGTVVTLFGTGTALGYLTFDTVGNNLYATTFQTIVKMSSTINVSSNIPASWTITGPATITGSGTSQSTLGKPSGTYTITWGVKSGYTKPATQSLTLDRLGDISLSGTYTAIVATPNCGTVQDADGNTYNTVVVGTQCWMAENLRTTKKPDGTSLILSTDYYCYTGDANCTNSSGNVDAYGAKYGALYNWASAMNLPAACNVYRTNSPNCPNVITINWQGICPAGWHIPKDDKTATAINEMWTLENYLKDVGQTCDASRFSQWQCATAGTKLQSGGSSGFNLPAGGQCYLGSCNARGMFGKIFSTGEYSAGMGNFANTRWIFQSSDPRDLASTQKVYRLESDDKVVSYSVRCVKDTTPTLTLSAVPTTVAYNAASTLTWTTSNATSCWGWSNDGTWDGWKTATSSSASTGPLTAAKTYSLECWNSAGVSSGIKTVTVNLSCTPNCDEAGSHCVGIPYSGNCGQTCTGTLPQNCPGGWGSCSKSCGGGTQTRTCACPSENQTRSCAERPCPPGYKEVAPW